MKEFYDKPHIHFEDSSIECTKRGSVRCLTQTFLRFLWDRQTHTHTHTHTQNDYCNPCCACALRVNHVFSTLASSSTSTNIRISVPFMRDTTRDTTRARARKYGKDAGLCDNEVGMAISIRDPYTSPFTSRCK